MRRAFTLIELLTIVAIIAIMVTVAVTSMTSGQRVARIRGATRDIFATVRQARSIALVTGQASVITYSTVKVDGESCARVVLDSVRLMSSRASSVVQTLSGDTIDLADPNGEAAKEKAPRNKTASAEATTTASSEVSGETVEEILFAPIDDDILRGMAVKVVVGTDLEDVRSDDVRKATASAFSNAESLVGKYAAAKKQAEEKKAAEATEDDDEDKIEEDETQEPVRIAWEPNGRCEPHQIWIYPSGSDPEEGLSIKVDRFGAAKVVSEEDDW